MKILYVFIQILMFPLVFLGLSWLFTFWVRTRNHFKLTKVGYATIFVIMSYIIGGVILFPLYFLFKPVKINGITYLMGFNLWGYWLISFFIVTPGIVTIVAYFLYFKKVPVVNFFKEAVLIGLYQLPWGWFFEIIIYVYWRKTIPSIYDYFFGKNFPWIDINWLIGVVSPLIAAYIAKHTKHINKDS